MKRVSALAIGLGCASYAWAATPVFYSSLDNDAAITSSGGAIVDSSRTYVAGQLGNAFQSTDSGTNAGGWARWDDSTINTLFNGWTNTNGITVDLYFRGSAWTGSSGNEGLWSMVRRNNVTGGDAYFITSVNNGKLRILFANDSNATHSPGTQLKYTFDNATSGEIAPNVPISNGVIYHLTANVGNGMFNVYLDDIGGNTYSNASPVASIALPAGYYWDLPVTGSVSSSGSMTGRQTREMDIGIRGFGNTGNTVNNFGGTLKNGDWVDEVSVYNGIYAPSDLVPEPVSAMLLIGALPLLRRRKVGC